MANENDNDPFDSDTAGQCVESLAELLRERIGGGLPGGARITLVISTEEHVFITSEGGEGHVAQLIERLYEDLKAHRDSQSEADRARQGRCLH